MKEGGRDIVEGTNKYTFAKIHLNCERKKELKILSFESVKIYDILCQVFSKYDKIYPLRPYPIYHPDLVFCKKNPTKLPYVLNKSA